jgi:predicted PurR-regulated permease PerM
MPTSRPGLSRQFVRRTWYQFAVAALLFLSWQLADVALLVFAAVIVAVVLRSLADPIRNHTPLNDGVSLAAAALLILAVLAGAGWLFGATVSAQTQDLMDRMPKSPEELRALLQRLPLGDALAGQVTDIGSWASRMRGVAGRLSGFAVNAFSAAANALLVVFAGAYLAIRPQRGRDGLVLLLPKSAAEPVRDALNASGRALKLWLGGTFIDMVVVGVLTGAGTGLIGLPSPMALGLFAGLAAFVPIVGPIVSVIPGVLLGLQQGPQMVLWTVLVYFGVQQIESNLIYPFVQRRAVDLPPALTLFGVLGFGVLLGPLGVVLATPLLVVAIVLTKLLYVRNALGKEVEVPGEGRRS